MSKIRAHKNGNVLVAHFIVKATGKPACCSEGHALGEHAELVAYREGDKRCTHCKRLHPLEGEAVKPSAPKARPNPYFKTRKKGANGWVKSSVPCCSPYMCSPCEHGLADGRGLFACPAQDCDVCKLEWPNVPEACKKCVFCFIALHDEQARARRKVLVADDDQWREKSIEQLKKGDVLHHEFFGTPGLR